jgi:hypothetical protein
MNNLARICRVFVVVVERGGIFGTEKVQDGHGTGITRECTGLRMSDDSSRSRSCHDVDGRPSHPPPPRSHWVPFGERETKEVVIAS